MTNEYSAYRVDDDVLMCTAEQTLVLVSVAEPAPDAGPGRATGGPSRASREPTSSSPCP